MTSAATLTDYLRNWRQHVFPRHNHLPHDLTTADWLKAIAVVIMLCDHVGFYLFPQFEWFRAVGRPGMPVWFFLVGFARKQDLPTRWLVGALILLVANLLIRMDPVPLNALFSMAICRVAVGPLWRLLDAKPVYFWWILFLLLFLGPVTNLLFEYGTFGVLFAAVGYAMRRRGEVARNMARDPVPAMFALILVVFIVFQWMNFAFDPLPGMFMAAGLGAMYFVLSGFENRTLPGTGDSAGAPLVRFMGRYTLEIYVIHLLLLKAVLGLQNLAIWLI